MALTEQEIKNLIKNQLDSYMDSKSITLSDLNPLVDDNGDVWIFGTKDGVDGKESVKINISNLRGVDGETREEVSAYKSSLTKPPTPKYIKGGNNNVPPEGWVLEQGMDGVWWRSRATFEVSSEGEYGEMVRAWSPPIKVSPDHGRPIKPEVRYLSSYQRTTIPTNIDRRNINPGVGWKKQYEYAENPNMNTEYISNSALPAQYNQNLKINPVFIWKIEGWSEDGKDLIESWSEPIMITIPDTDTPEFEPPTLTPIVNISATGNHIKCDPDTFNPLPDQRIVITAKHQGFGDDLVASMITFRAISYKTNGSAIQDVSLIEDKSDIETPSAILTSENWDAQFASVKITCTIKNGSKTGSASTTIYRFSDGGNSMLGYFQPATLNILAENNGEIPPANIQDERTQFVLFDGGKAIIDKETNNPDVKFTFMSAKLGFVVAIAENGVWVCSNKNAKVNNILVHGSSAKDEGDGSLKIVDYPISSDNMYVTVKATYGGRSTSADFSVNKTKAPREPDKPPIQDTNTEEEIFILTKIDVRPTLTIKSEYLDLERYQTDGFVPNRLIDGDNATWTPSGTEWYGEVQEVDEIWRYLWYTKRTKTNGVWGNFGRILRKSAYTKPDIPKTKVFTLRLNGGDVRFYGKSGERKTATISAYLDEEVLEATTIQVEDNVGVFSGVSHGIFDFSIDTKNQQITFTLNKKVETYTTGEIPINVVVRGQHYVLDFKYIVYQFTPGGGEDAPFLDISASSYFMMFDSNNNVIKNQEIILKAKTINITGSPSFVAKPFDKNGKRKEGTVTLSGTGNTRVLKSEYWDKTTAKVEVTVSIPGTTLNDSTTIYRHQDIKGVVSGYLTNSWITLNPDSSGDITFFDYAIGNFIVNDGSKVVTNESTFSVSREAEGCTVVIDTDGSYRVTSMTGDGGIITLKAVYNSEKIYKDLTLVRGREPIITGDNAILTIASSSVTFTRDLTDTDTYYQDSEPKEIRVQATHSNIRVDSLKWTFQIDGAGDYKQYDKDDETLRGIKISPSNNDVLIITTAELTGVSSILNIKIEGNTIGNNSPMKHTASIQVIPYSRNGIPGKTPFTREWVEGETHRNNIYYVDFIYYRDDDHSYRNGWFKLKTIPERLAPASPYTDSEGTTLFAINGEDVYEKIDDLGSKAFNIVIAEEANLAGFVFKNNRLYSQEGLDLENPDATAMLIINGNNGEITARDAKIKGEIVATSGVIGNLNLENGFLTGYDGVYNPDDAPEFHPNATMGLNANRKDGSLAFWAGGSYVEVANYINSYNNNKINPNPEFDINKKITSITHDGNAFFNNAEIVGKITAKEGWIGDFKIVGSDLIGYSDIKNENGIITKIPTVGLYTSDPRKTDGSSRAFWAGYNMDSYVRIYHNGKIEASNVEICGDITASTGSIGGFSINGDELISTDPNKNIYINGKTGQLIAKNANITGNITSQSLITRPNGKEYISLNESDDNQFLFRYPNGGIAIRMGLMDGQPVMIWYNQEGNEVWRGGESGIRYITGSKATTTQVKKIKVAPETHQPTTLNVDNPQVDLTINSSLSSVACKDSQGRLYTETSNNRPFYRYWAGVNDQTSINEKYEGLHADSNVHSTSNWVENGWYVTQGGIGQFINVGGEGSLQSISIEKYIAGQMVGSTIVHVNVDPNSVRVCKYILK